MGKGSGSTRNSNSASAYVANQKGGSESQSISENAKLLSTDGLYNMLATNNKQDIAHMYGFGTFKEFGDAIRDLASSKELGAVESFNLSADIDGFLDKSETLSSLLKEDASETKARIKSFVSNGNIKEVLGMGRSAKMELAMRAVDNGDAYITTHWNDKVKYASGKSTIGGSGKYVKNDVDEISKLEVSYTKGYSSGHTFTFSQSEVKEWVKKTKKSKRWK